MNIFRIDPKADLPLLLIDKCLRPAPWRIKGWETPHASIQARHQVSFLNLLWKKLTYDHCLFPHYFLACELRKKTFQKHWPELEYATIHRKAGGLLRISGQAKCDQLLWFLAWPWLQTGLELWQKLIKSANLGGARWEKGQDLYSSPMGVSTNPRFGRKKGNGHGHEYRFLNGRWKEAFGERMMIQIFEYNLQSPHVYNKLPAQSWTNQKGWLSNILPRWNRPFHWKQNGVSKENFTWFLYQTASWSHGERILPPATAIQEQQGYEWLMHSARDLWLFLPYRTEVALELQTSQLQTTARYTAQWTVRVLLIMFPFAWLRWKLIRWRAKYFG